MLPMDNEFLGRSALGSTRQCPGGSGVTRVGTDDFFGTLLPSYPGLWNESVGVCDFDDGPELFDGFEKHLVLELIPVL